MRITLRDADVVRRLIQYELLNARHLATLFGTREISKRLRILLHNGYILRLPSHLFFHTPSGSLPAIYGPSNQGAALVERMCGVPVTKTDWTAKTANRPLWKVPHLMLTNNLLIALERSCARQGLRYLDRAAVALRAEALGAELPKGLRLHAPVGRRSSELVTTTPDAIAGFESDRFNLLFVEADCATEPEQRFASPDTSSIRKKLDAYKAYGRIRGERRQFASDNFRVLFVTSAGEGRIRGMLDAVRASTNGQGSRRYLFATAEQVEVADLLTTGWLNGCGEFVSLL